MVQENIIGHDQLLFLSNSDVDMNVFITIEQCKESQSNFQSGQITK